MRSLRLLKQGVWYAIHTRINNREPLFRHGKALSMFVKVFQETKKRFVFQIRGLQLVDDGLSFYIKPTEARELPVIMKWLKQVFAQRYNHSQGREGHIWGDRYKSQIIDGEPPKAELGEVSGIRVRPSHGEPSPQPFSLPLFLLPRVPAPG
ncbi:MAG: transposase [Spirochaetaceae bacterium]|nr:transposase [Spirochaetaceae bacterium]